MSQLQQIEYTIEQLKARKLRAAKFNKLMNNREFKELILDEYLTQEPARLNTLLVQPHLRETTVSQLMGISRFSEHLRFLEGLFADIDSDLEEAEEIRNQLMTEED